MGLTIHYGLKSDADSPARARQQVEKLRQAALDLPMIVGWAGWPVVARVGGLGPGLVAFHEPGSQPHKAQTVRRTETFHSVSTPRLNGRTPLDPRNTSPLPSLATVRKDARLSLRSASLRSARHGVFSTSARSPYSSAGTRATRKPRWSYRIAGA